MCVITMSNPVYEFLVDTPLMQSVADCIHDTPTSTYLCIYSMPPTFQIDSPETANPVGPIPYLKYIVQCKSDSVVFPSVDFAFVDGDDVDARFQTSCVKTLFEVLELKLGDNSSASWNTWYKGVACVKTGDQTSLFAVLHYDPIVETYPAIHAGKYPIRDENPNRLGDSPIRWATVDELLFRRTVLGVPVDPAISHVFAQHAPLWNITVSGRYIDFPFSVYCLAKQEDDVYASKQIPEIYEDAVDRMNRLIDDLDTLDNYTYADEYADRYCFSVDPIGVNDPKRCIRYAVYPVNTKYVMQECSKGQVGGGEPTDKVLEPTNKVLEPTDNVLEPTDKVLEQDTVVEEPEPTTVDKSEEPANDSETQYRKMSVSTLYYIETRLAKNEPMWGILNRGQIDSL